MKSRARLLTLPSMFTFGLAQAYLKLAQKKLGLLINFNVPTLPEGIVRLIN